MTFTTEERMILIDSIRFRIKDIKSQYSPNKPKRAKELDGIMAEHEDLLQRVRVE